MQIVLKKISLKNFKGTKDLTIDFTKNTNIYGENGTGKTTIFDAFTWVLFGKDSQGAKDFDLKTKDKQGNFISKIEHSVEATLEVDSEEIVLKSILKEKWTTKRGNTEPVFSGNETTYFVNDVPMKQEEYRKKINSIVDEEIFKLITNPSYFEGLKWQDKRNILMNLVDGQTDEELAGKIGFENLAEILSSKTLEEYKKEIAAKKKKIKAELDAIPTRIDEVVKNTPEEENWEELEKEKAQIGDKLKHKVDEIIKAEMPSEKEVQHTERVNGIKNEMLKLKSKLEAEYHDKKSGALKYVRELELQLSEVQSKIKSYDSKVISCEREIKESESLMEKLREQICSIKDRVFDENDKICPSCGRPYESDKVEEMKERFEISRQEEFAKLNERGKSLKAGVNSLQNMIDENKILRAEQTSLESELSDKLKNARVELESIAEVNIYENEDYKKLESELESLKAVTFEKADIEQIEKEKEELDDYLIELNKRLSAKELIDRSAKRIDELNEEQRSYSQKKADLEKIEFDIESFTKAKIEDIEAQVNKKFKFVRFKMFETQINGAEVECCRTLVEGVTSGNSLNTGATIRAGVEIINTLSEYYKIYAPIFIDNRESITESISSDSQIVSLIVSENDKKLRVEAE